MVYEKLCELLSRQLDISVDDITPDTHIIDDLGADSLDIVELIATLEDEFNLIITDELRRAMELAAKRGVDVRLITPGVPDKKTVWAVTRSYYAPLVSGGVRIFEYAPGFCHGKMAVSDGCVASIGTSNLDYRSLYLHFENNVLLYDCQGVEDIARDFEEIFPQCREVTEQYRTGSRKILMLWQCILRLFAPLM